MFAFPEFGNIYPKNCRHWPKSETLENGEEKQLTNIELNVYFDHRPYTFKVLQFVILPKKL